MSTNNLGTKPFINRGQALLFEKKLINLNFASLNNFKIAYFIIFCSQLKILTKLAD